VLNGGLNMSQHLNRRLSQDLIRHRRMPRWSAKRRRRLRRKLSRWLLDLNSSGPQVTGHSDQGDGGFGLAADMWLLPGRMRYGLVVTGAGAVTVTFGSAGVGVRTESEDSWGLVGEDPM
jgi:hypothetical protein